MVEEAPRPTPARAFAEEDGEELLVRRAVVIEAIQACRRGRGA